MERRGNTYSVVTCERYEVQSAEERSTKGNALLRLDDFNGFGETSLFLSDDLCFRRVPNTTPTGDFSFQERKRTFASAFGVLATDASQLCVNR